MKKIILLLILVFMLVSNVDAASKVDQFYNAGTGAPSTWITRTNGIRTLSSNPYVLRRIRDDRHVYCIEPVVLVSLHTNYNGYFNLENKFNISEEAMNRIRLISYFGYMYPGHEDIKWYGITQYLIWQELEGNYDVFFADRRHGNRISRYVEEIKQIEHLISSYKELLLLDGNKYTFRSLDELDELIKTNIFLRDISFSQNQIVRIPINPLASENEVFYYRADAQNLYLFGQLGIPGITLDMELLVPITIQKWYGTEENHLPEEGAMFSIFKEDEFIKNVETDEHGIATFYLLPGTYRVMQIRSIDGFMLADEFELIVGHQRLNHLIEILNEPEIIEVPDTNKDKEISLWDYINIDRRKYAKKVI